MKEEKIRPTAICVCSHQGHILVTEYVEKGRLYYRPVGGGIDFGERGQETVRREFREELGADLENVRYLGLLENIYTYDGRRFHQLVLVYDGRLSDANLYTLEAIFGDELGQAFKAVWMRLDEFGPGKAQVYPEGLLALLGIKKKGDHLIGWPPSLLAHLCWQEPLAKPHLFSFLGSTSFSVGYQPAIQITEHIADDRAKDEQNCNNN